MQNISSRILLKPSINMIGEWLRWVKIGNGIRAEREIWKFAVVKLKLERLLFMQPVNDLFIDAADYSMDALFAKST